MPRPRWLLAMVWSVPAALLTAQTYVFYGPGDLGYVGRAAIRAGLPWAIWMVVTPAILRAAARPGALRGWRIARHVAAALAIGAAFGAANGALGFAALRWDSTPTLASAIQMAIVDWVPLQLIVYAAVLATGIALEAAHRRRLAELEHVRLEAQLARAQLAALRAQLQPHFLFNTLNAAVTLARAGDTEGTARVLVLLGELLRQLLRTDAPQEVPLAEELRLLETYLEIQQVRFGERLRVRWDIAEEVRDALVPQLVLQPLVENALLHGIAQRTQAGRLDITAERVGDDLRLTVRDDGPGLAPGFTLAGATGVGLRNTAERLRRLYGARGDVQLARARDGTVAAVVLPLHAEALGG